MSLTQTVSKARTKTTGTIPVKSVLKLDVWSRVTLNKLL